MAPLFTGDMHDMPANGFGLQADFMVRGGVLKEIPLHASQGRLG